MKGLRLSEYLDETTYLGKGAISGKLFPVTWTQHLAPGVELLPLKPKIHSEVLGEIYQVDEEALTTLDLVEGHPDLYRRVSTVASDGVNLFDVDVYIWPHRGGRGPCIPSGDWRKYLLSL